MPQSSYTAQVTKRFLEEMDRIVRRREGEKVTANDFAERVGIRSTNLSRMRTGQGSYNVTMEACCRLCQEYGTDPGWLFLGKVSAGQLPGEDINKRFTRLEKRIYDQQVMISTLVNSMMKKKLTPAKKK